MKGRLKLETEFTHKKTASVMPCSHSPTAIAINFASHSKQEEECIPVGCVPPTHRPYLVVSHACPPTTTHAPHNHTCSPTTMHTQPTTTHASQPCTPPQPCMPTPATMHTPLTTMHAPPRNHAHPPMNRMTNRCKNITLPQTSFAGGN